MRSSDFLKVAQDLGLGRQVQAAKQAAARAVWSSPQTREKTRPLRVETMLRKEKDGTLVKEAPHPHEEKNAALSQPGGADYSEPERDPGAARLQAPQRIPSREDMAGGVRREDTRSFTTTVAGPGTVLNEVGPQPAYIKTGSLGGKLLTSPGHADLVGLGLMAAGQADRVQGALRGDSEGVLGETARTGMDVAGFGVMALPYLAQKMKHPPSNLETAAVLGGLGALMVPTADNLQARLRAQPGEDPAQKNLLGHKAHEALELAGYGTFGALSLRDAIKNRSGLDALHAAGYGTLAAPHVEEMLKHKGEPRVFDDKTRALTDAAGLGMLIVPTAAHLKHASIGKQALLDRLIRLGATDIPHTPRLFMRHRTPQELGAMQHRVQTALGRVAEPLRAKGYSAVSRVVGKTPAWSLRGKTLPDTIERAGKWVVDRAVDHPDALALHAAAGVVPIPGVGMAVDLGWVKAKQLAEKLIDKHLPVPSPV